MERFLIDETSSTQDEAFKLLDIHSSVLVMARRQRAGRGRRGHTWSSREGGLYVSIGWKGMDPGKALLLNLVAPVAIVNTLKNFGIESKIKLPNDVMVEMEKIAGILIERRGEKTVMGIGLNVNQKDFPSGVKATSMSLITGKDYQIGEVMKILERELIELISRTPHQVADHFSQYMIGGPVQFLYRGQKVEDILEGVDANLEAIGRRGRYLLPWMEDVRYTTEKYLSHDERRGL